MKRTCLLAITAMCFSTQAAQTIYDEDTKAERTTIYSSGPVQQMTTLSSSAYSMQIHYTTKDYVSCPQAAVYDEATDQLISDFYASNQVITGSIPPGLEKTEKSLRLNCEYTNGEKYTIHHKIPAVPNIQWESQLTPENLVPASAYNPSYYQELNYDSQVLFNNHVGDGECVAGNNVGTTPLLLGDSNRVTNRVSDYFVTSGQAYYQDIRTPYLVSELICKTAGGTTRAVEIWTINENTKEKAVREFSIENF